MVVSLACFWRCGMEMSVVEHWSALWCWSKWLLRRYWLTGDCSRSVCSVRGGSLYCDNISAVYMTGKCLCCLKTEAIVAIQCVNSLAHGHDWRAVLFSSHLLSRWHSIAAVTELEFLFSENYKTKHFLILSMCLWYSQASKALSKSLPGLTLQSPRQSNVCNSRAMKSRHNIWSDNFRTNAQRKLI